jgi:hypothetical protein
MLWLTVGLVGVVAMLLLAVGLLILAAPWLIALGTSWWDRRQLQSPAPPAPPEQRATVQLSACLLVKGVQVLTQSTPYRFRQERVVWIEKQQMGRVVAALEGPDPETGMPQQRWHVWQPRDPVQVFVGAVEIQQHGGDYGDLYSRFAEQQEEQPQEHKAEQGKRERGQYMTELTFPWDAVR